MNLCQHAKKSLISSVHSGDKASFTIERPDWPHPFLNMLNLKILNQLLIFVNLYQLAKNYAVSPIGLGEMVDLKIQEADWLKPFWPISQEQDFA